MAEPIKIPIEFTFNENGLNEVLHFVADLQKKYDDLENEVSRLHDLVINKLNGIEPIQAIFNNENVRYVANQITYSFTPKEQ